MLVPENFKPVVLSLQSQLKRMPLSCKWVEPENLHITLSFLGEVPSASIEHLNKELDACCKLFQPFVVEVNGLQLIPSERFIRVLALKIRSAQLEKLVERVHQKLNGKLTPPHLTLGRVKRVLQRNEFLQAIKPMQTMSLGKFCVSSVEMVESVLTPKGPIYRVLHSAELLPA